MPNFSAAHRPRSLLRRIVFCTSSELVIRVLRLPVVACAFWPAGSVAQVNCLVERDVGHDIDETTAAHRQNGSSLLGMIKFSSEDPARCGSGQLPGRSGRIPRPLL